jgi:hypothetical protein
MSRAATRESLEQLWFAVLDCLINYFRVTPADEVTGAMLTVARQFLNDSHISLESIQRSGGLEAAAIELRATASIPFPLPKGAKGNA